MRDSNLAGCAKTPCGGKPPSKTAI